MKRSVIPLMILLFASLAYGQQGAVDLTAGAPHLTEDRHIAFLVFNRSNVATPNFQAVLYVNGALKQTFTASGRLFGILSFKTDDTWTNCEPPTPLRLKVVVDPDNHVAESDETNNTNSVTLTSPCPDVTATISKKWVNNNLQYKARIEVINRGQVIMPKVSVRTLGLPFRPNDSPPPVSNCLSNPALGCLKDVSIVGPLAPGQSFAYEPGGKYDLAQKLAVQVEIICGNGAQPPQQVECIESNYTNNTVRKGL